MHQSPKKCPRRYDNCFSEVLDFKGCFDAESFPILVKNFRCLSLFYIQIWLRFANPFHAKLVGLFIALSARSPDSRTFFGVQHPELQPGHVRVPAHLPTQSINFARQMPLGESADGRVARHLSDCVCIHGKQQGLTAHSGSSQ